MPKNAVKSRTLIEAAFGVINMRVFKVQCVVCGDPAIIRKSEWKDRKVADLYCACSNVDCGHTFVFNATYSHALSPSGLTSSTLVKALLERLKPDERQMALDLLQGQPR